MKNPVRGLRRVALLEAVSFLVLLGIAMPLKYYAGMPAAVKIAGWVHGGLFVWFGIALLGCLLIAKWPLSRCALVFAASLVPVVPFFMDRRMRQWEADQPPIAS